MSTQRLLLTITQADSARKMIASCMISWTLGYIGSSVHVGDGLATGLSHVVLDHSQDEVEGSNEGR
jgi:hypothetical protein